MLKRALLRYTSALQTHPLRTNVASAFVIFSIGDVSAQYLEFKERKKRESKPSFVPYTTQDDPFVVDGNRLFKIINWSVFIYTPIFYKLYAHFDRRWPKKTPVSVFKKVLGASISAVPTNAIFFGYNAAYPYLMDFACGEIDRIPVQKIKQDTARKISDDLGTTIKASMTLWWPVNAANFAFVPGTYRALWTSAFSVVWSTYLSLVAHKSAPCTNVQRPQRRETNMSPALAN